LVAVAEVVDQEVLLLLVFQGAQEAAEEAEVLHQQHQEDLPLKQATEAV
jgi:hypothetical protein